jgi:hypothetical protein
MKNLILLGMMSLMGVMALAQAQEEQIAADVQSILNPPVRVAAEAQTNGREPLLQADVQGIMQTRKYEGGLKFNLQPGHYVIGSERSEKDYYSLFIQKSVNGRDEYVAVLLNNSVIREHSAGFTTMGRIYMGKPFMNGTKLMLAPVHLDGEGKLLNNGKEDRKSPVLLISMKPPTVGKEYPHYPYLIEEVHGTLKGEMLGMAGGSAHVNLMTSQSNYSFHSEGEEVIVGGNQLSQMVNGDVARRYLMNEYNGDVTPIFALTNTDIDTVAESMTSGIAIQKVAFFLQPQDCHSSGCGLLVIGSDIGGGMDWQMRVYKPHEAKGFLEKFFIKLFHLGGNLNPTDGGW